MTDVIAGREFDYSDPAGPAKVVALLDNGATFTPNARVTFAGSIDAGQSTFIGDYAGIAAAAGFAHPVWTDGGFNGGRLQTATLQAAPVVASR